MPLTPDTPPTQAVDDILAMLTSEFGKKSTRKPAKAKKVAGTATDTAKSAIQLETSEANRIARLMQPQTPWRPVALVVHLVEQTCRCCHGTTEFVGNVLIRHEHRVTNARWDCLMPENPSHALLPREMFPHQQSIEQCPSCLRMEFFASQIPARQGIQRSLFS
jgi:hypothetical protein